MITYANSLDKEAVYRLWKQAFAHDDGGYTDYYFQNRYGEAVTYVYKVAGEVVATLQRRSHQFMFDEHKISASLILGVATLPAHQGKGYMRLLMNKALADARQEESMTMIQAYQPEMYFSFGFVPYYFYKEVVYQPKSSLIYGELKDVDVQQCVMLYQTMMKHYTGYMLRDEVYYQNYQVELKAQGFIMVGYYEADLMKAYAVLEQTETLHISEVVGTHATCDVLLALIYEQYGPFTLRNTSTDKCDLVDTMLVFHDWNVSKQLLQTDACDPEAYFTSLKKPLFLHENA